jgi:photosynthetic reaction center cytochrome c subunit
MRVASQHQACRFAACLGAVLVWASGQAVAQTPRDTRPAEQVFKNILSLKGIPADEFMSTMGFFSASLGYSCVNCHGRDSGGDWAAYAGENDIKRKSRAMIAMVNAMNKNFFAGKRMLTCYTCHRGTELPDTTPDITQFYSMLRYREPDKMVSQFPNAPEPGEILNKYLAAIGGEQKAATLTSIVAKGTFQAYGIPTKYALDVYAKLPPQRSITVHNLADSDYREAFDGREAWVSQSAQLSPVPFMERTGQDIDVAKLYTALMFPSQIKTLLTNWKVGPPAVIDDRDTTMVQGTINGKVPVNLYFDDETALLSRVVTYVDSPVGLSPTQEDFSDYREVAGLKVPYKIVVTWLDGKSILQLSEIQPNAPVEASRFARPAK